MGSLSLPVLLYSMASTLLPFVSSFLYYMRKDLRTGSWIRLSRCQVFLILFFVSSQEVFCSEDCGRTFTNSSGIFDSPNYPNNYHTNQDCTYIISRPRGQRISLKFLLLDLPPVDSGGNCLDYVEVFDGNSTATPRFGRYCGSRKPLTTKLRTTQNEMLVRFHSDETFTDKGFRAEYSSDTLGDQIIIVAGQRFLQRIDFTTISGTDPVPVLLNNLSNIEFDTFDYRIYWTERRDSRIHSVLLNGSDERIIMDIGEGAVFSDIALDAPSDLLFYVDSGNDVIGILTTSGDTHKRIIATDLDDQSTIAVNTKTGKVYWTTRKTVEAANYDGSNITTLFSQSGIRTIVSVAVDSELGYVYFLDTDHQNATIQSLDSNGGQPRLHITLSQRIMTTTRVFAYDGKIYYSSINVNRTDRPSQMGSVTWGGRTDVLFYTSTLEDAAFYNETAAYHMPTECRKNRTEVCKSDEICIPSSKNDVMCISSDSSSYTAEDVDNRVVIIGGSLGAFAFIVTVALIVLAVVFVKRKGRKEAEPMPLSEIHVQPRANPYTPDTKGKQDGEEVYENPAVDLAAEQADGLYIEPVPDLPPMRTSDWRKSADNRAPATLNSKPTVGDESAIPSQSAYENPSKTSTNFKPTVEGAYEPLTSKPRDEDEYVIPSQPACTEPSKPSNDDESAIPSQWAYENPSKTSTNLKPTVEGAYEPLTSKPRDEDEYVIPSQPACKEPSKPSNDDVYMNVE